MNKLLIASLLLVCIISGCRKGTNPANPSDCLCPKHQVCINYACQCPDWTEGDSCNIPVRNKFIGTYIGNLFLNGANPQPDTITFAVKANSPINYLYAVNRNFGIYVRFSRQVNYFTDVTTTKQVDSGVGLLSDDGHTLTLTYLPVSSNGNIDSTSEYTFIGARQ